MEFSFLFANAMPKSSENQSLELHLVTGMLVYVLTYDCRILFYHGIHVAKFFSLLWNVDPIRLDNIVGLIVGLS